MGQLIASAIVVGVVGAVLLVVGYLMVMTASIHLFGQSIVTANHTLPAGSEIRAEDLVTVTMPGPAIENAFTEVEPLIGRVVTSQILAGDPIRSERLAHPGRKNWMQAVMEPGMRTVWIEFGVGAVGKGILPGDRIDVWASFATQRGVVQTVSAAELVHVIQINPATPLRPERLTVAATPDQVAAITKHRAEAQLHLVLRSDREIKHDRSELVIEAQTGTDAPLEAHARVDLIPGQPLNAEDLVMRLSTGVGPSGFPSAEELVGATPHSRVLAGERLVPERLAEASTGRGLASLVDVGEAVMAIGVGEDIDDFEIGSHVTAMAAVPGRRLEELATDLRILGHHLEGEGCPCVQLVVDADAVGHLIHAQAMGRLALTLPN